MMTQGVLIEYAMGPKRPNKPGQQITSALQATALQVLGPGATVRITSGMGEHGSVRHRGGHAADVQFIDPQGRVVTLDDPRSKQIALAAAQNGITGLGAGHEYMGGSTFHMDVYPVDQYTPKMGRAWGSWGNKHESAFVNGHHPGDGHNHGSSIQSPPQSPSFDSEKATDLMQKGVDPRLANAIAGGQMDTPHSAIQSGLLAQAGGGQIPLPGLPNQQPLDGLLGAAMGGGVAFQGGSGVKMSQPRFSVQRGADGLDKFVTL